MRHRLLLCVVIGTVSWTAAVGSQQGGHVLIPKSAWDVQTSAEKENFIRSWCLQCRNRGYAGIVYIWADDGKTLLAKREPEEIDALINNPPAPVSTYGEPAGLYSQRMQSSSGPQAVGGLFLVAAVVCGFILALAVAVAIIRWVFRINAIVANQEKILAELGRISRSDAGAQ